MLFAEALQELKKGKQVVRAAWGDNDGYLVFLPGMKNVWKITNLPSVNAGNNLFSVEDFCASDWQLYNPGEKENADEGHNGVCQ